MQSGNISVKICGVSSAEMAERIAQLGADYVGVIHHATSSRHVALEEMGTVVAGIAPEKRVAVTVDPDPGFLKTLREAGFRHFQLHFKTFDAERAQQWADTVGAGHLWFAPKIRRESDFDPTMLNFAQTVVLDTYSADAYGGTGQTGNWPLFRSLQQQYPEVRFFLAGGLNPENLTEAIESSSARCVDLSTGVESSPGVKDLDRVKALFSLEVLKRGMAR